MGHRHDARTRERDQSASTPKGWASDSSPGPIGQSDPLARGSRSSQHLLLLLLYWLDILLHELQHASSVSQVQLPILVRELQHPERMLV